MKIKTMKGVNIILKINYTINIDKGENKEYNESNIEIFTYEDYIQYKTVMACKKIQLSDVEEKYELSYKVENKSVNNEHDKLFRKILSNKTEATKFINGTLGVNIEEDDLDKYISLF